MKESIIMEIKAGEGGDDACLWAEELLSMYLKHSTKNNWESVILYQSYSKGYLKEVTLKISGSDVYKRLKNESGGHRVQRVPKTESRSRVHTSNATVSVMRVPKPTEIVINEKDIRIDTFRSKGAGGQNVNKTSSGVRVVHLPTNTVVICQNERSQYQNKEEALQVLASRLYNAKAREEETASKDMKKRLAGTGDRSEKIRTYNFIEDRVTDHRTGNTEFGIKKILSGNIG